MKKLKETKSLKTKEPKDKEMGEKQKGSEDPEKTSTKHIKVIIEDKKDGNKEFLVKKEAIFEFSKRPYKVKEEKSKISNGEICVMYLRENGVGDFMYVRPENGMFLLQGNYYHQHEACVHSMGPKRIPLAIIPEWSMTPLSRRDFSKLMGEDAQLAQKLIIKSIEHAEIVKIDKEMAPAKAGNTKALIWWVIIAAVGIALASNFLG